MAEAFGLAASAAGIVSLGLQVYEGVASYVEGVKDRKTELSAISKQASTLQAIVNALQVAAPRIDAILSIHESPLLPSLKTVEEELWALKLFLGSLQNTDSQPKHVLATLKEQKRKLTFPFHRPTLEKLQKKLESANNALQTSLQVVELTATALIHTTISDIRAIVDNSQSLVTNLQSGVGTLETSMNSMALSLAPTQASIGSMEGRLNLLATEGRNNNENLDRNFHTVHTSMSHLSDEVDRAMNSVQMSTGQVHGAVLQQGQEIRQLQDIVSESIVQPSVIVTAIEAALAKKFAELAKATSDHANLSQPQLIMGRLLSKPSELKDAHDVGRIAASITRRHREAPIFTAQRNCSCHLRTATQHQAKKFGDFYLVRETKIQPQHLPDCEIRAFISESATHKRTLSYTGLRKLLSVSLELSFSWTSGAGGLSISPNINLRPMVDETRSPAFRLIDLVQESYFWILCSDVEFEYILGRSMNAILKFYRTKVCSPYDVNFRGESVLHKWIDLVSRVFRWKRGSTISAQVSMTALSSTRRLVAGWSPNTTLFDYYGKSPLDYATGYDLVATFPLREVATLLCSYDDELAIRARENLEPHDNMIELRDVRFEEINHILESPVFIDLYGLGPLSTSVVSGNRDRVQSSLDTDISTLEEKNHALQTPFHLAAIKPNHELLKVLLGAAQDGSTRFDTMDAKGRSALDVAAINSGQLCRYGLAYELCTDCVCSLPFDMLQSHGWQLSPKIIVSPCELLMQASQAVRMKMISNIKRFREDLRAVALHYLSPYEYQRLQLDDSRTLDGHTKRVVERLLESDLRISKEYEDLVDILSRTRGDCIYHDLIENFKYLNDIICPLADLLFDSGFKDVDHEDEYGISPLQHLVTPSTYRWRYRTSRSLELFVWFIHHGANISQVITKSWDVWGATLTDTVMCLHLIHRYKKSAIYHTAEALRRIAPLGLFDKCRCGCVGTGCSTTTIFFRNLWQWFFRDKDIVHKHYYNDYEDYESSLEGVQEVSSSKAESVSDSYKDDTDDESVCQAYPDSERANGINTENDTSSELETIGSESAWGSENDENGTTDFWQSTHNLSTYLQLLEVDFVKWDHVSLSALKVFTFEALEIRHTCCHKLGKSIFEGMRVQWEDVPVCENEIDEVQEEDHELLGLLDNLVEEFVDELQSSGNSLQEFLVQYWAPRMEHVLEDLRAAKMSPEQVLAAEQIGVTWENDSGSESEDEDLCLPIPTASERFEALVKQMDDIVAESSQSGRT